MCKTYNSIGSLTAIKSRLNGQFIDDFKSVKDLIDFKQNYSNHKQEIISDHTHLLNQEKLTLEKDLNQLSIEIDNQKRNTELRITDEIDELKQQLNDLTNTRPGNFLIRIVTKIREKIYRIKIKRREQNFHIEVQKSIKEKLKIHQSKYTRYQFLNSTFNEAVIESTQESLSKLLIKKAAVDDLNTLIYGALGEQKVVKTLEVLSDEYHLINDFAISFQPPIYNKKENDYIKSIQIDHILVAPSGIFLIETKNWSGESLENQSLRSPVDQIRRTSFVLFKLLNNAMSNFEIGLKGHHWGDKKIPIRNLIVLTNTKPNEEFQYVKILTVNELSGYIKYFKPIFTIDETNRVADYLIKLIEPKH